MLASERRAHFRVGLSTLYQPFYDALCGQLGPEWQPYCANRTFEEQDFLYAKGRSSVPIGIQYRVTGAKGGQSAHNYGCGSDWTRFDGETLLWLKKEDPLWQQYITAVKRVGLRSGFEYSDVDHNELLLDCDWPHILLSYSQEGMTAAQQHIEAAMVYRVPLTKPGVQPTIQATN